MLKSVRLVTQGLGISCQPDFIADIFLASGRTVEILAEYSIPELGIYAMLPGNHNGPHRVRGLMESLAEQLAAQ